MEEGWAEAVPRKVSARAVRVWEAEVEGEGVLDLGCDLVFLGLDESLEEDGVGVDEDADVDAEAKTVLASRFTFPLSLELAVQFPFPVWPSRSS